MVVVIHWTQSASDIKQAEFFKAIAEAAKQLLSSIRSEVFNEH
jgi:hypothetical protein